MSEFTDDGGPAFPVILPYENRIESAGMSLRDWFAGQALAMLADPNFQDDVGGIAAACYRVADAMLRQREIEDVREAR